MQSTRVERPEQLTLEIGRWSVSVTTLAVTLVFVLVAGWLVINTLLNRPVESVAGLVLIALGLPIYFYYRRRSYPSSNSRT